MRRRRVKLPPVLDCCRVLEYAVLGRSVKYSGHSYLYVDGKELGPVPRLAICQALDDAQVLLFHCNRAWSVLGAAGYSSIKDAKKSAERIYPGVSATWVKTGVSKAQARTHLDKIWKGRKCSFCGKRPDQINQLIQKGDACICDVCIGEFHEMLAARKGHE